MSDHTLDRLLVSSKLQPEGIVSLFGIQYRDNARGATIVGDIASFHCLWESASDGLFDVVESVTCQQICPRFLTRPSRQLTSCRPAHWLKRGNSGCRAPWSRATEHESLPCR